MTAKEYLKLAYKLDRAIKRRQEIAQKHRESLYGKGVDYSGAGQEGKNGKDALGAAIASVRDYEYETEHEIIPLLIETRLDIEKSINLLSDKMQREVLTDRYLLYMPWKNKYDKDTGELLEKGIREKTGYSLESVYKFHSEGLKKIKIPRKITVKYSEIQFYL